MNTQINVRMSEDLLNKSKDFAKQMGFGNVQDFIRETIREKVFEDDIRALTKIETFLLRKKLKKAEESGYLSEDESKEFLDSLRK